jgi:hypothetical protein
MPPTVSITTDTGELDPLLTLIRSFLEADIMELVVDGQRVSGFRGISNSISAQAYHLACIPVKYRPIPPMYPFYTPAEPCISNSPRNC